MLSCDKMKDLLSAYYDGELGVAAQKQAAEHLASCGECREEFEQLKTLSGAFDTLKFPVYDKEFLETLHARLEAEAKKRGSVRTGRVWSGICKYAAAAACVVVIAGVLAAVQNHSFKPYSPVPSVTKSETAHTPKNENADLYVPKDTAAPTEIRKENDNTKPKEYRAAETPKDGDGLSEVQSTETETTPEYESYSSEAASKEAETNIKDTLEFFSPPMQPVNRADAETDESPVILEDALAAGIFGDGGAASSGGGGGTTSPAAGVKTVDTTITANFIMTDTTQYDAVNAVLGNFGTVTAKSGSLTVKVLNANYSACLAALRSIGGLSETGTVKEAAAETEYCYIQINFAD